MNLDDLSIFGNLAFFSFDFHSILETSTVAIRNKCLTSNNKKLLETSALLVVTSALPVVTSALLGLTSSNNVCY